MPQNALPPPSPDMAPRDLTTIGTRRLNELILERVKFGCTQFVGEDVLGNIKLDTYADMVSGQIVHSFRTYILSEKTKEEGVTNRFRYPKNSWEHFKYEFAPKWFLSRWPVRWNYEKKTTLVKHFVCLPKFGQFLDPAYQRHSFQNMTFDDVPQSSFQEEL